MVMVAGFEFRAKLPKGPSPHDRDASPRHRKTQERKRLLRFHELPRPPSCHGWHCPADLTPLVLRLITGHASLITDDLPGSSSHISQPGAAGAEVSFRATTNCTNHTNESVTTPHRSAGLRHGVVGVRMNSGRHMRDGCWITRTPGWKCIRDFVADPQVRKPGRGCNPAHATEPRRRSAGFEPAVSPIFNRRARQQPMIAFGFAERYAGCKPAIRQLESCATHGYRPFCCTRK
jgi:hypothetical protein